MCLCLPFISLAQSNNRDEQKKAEKVAQHEQMKQLLADSNWAVTAHTLRDRRGNNAFVNPSTNFVAIAGEEALVQIAVDNFYPGLNGLGGQTLEGRLTKYTVKDRGLGKGFDIRMDFVGIFTFNIWVWVSDNGNATLTLSGMRGQRLTYLGDISLLEDAGIFVGNQSLFR